MINRKLLVAIIAATGTAAAVGITYFVKKRRNTKNNNDDVIDVGDLEDLDIDECHENRIDPNKVPMYKLIGYLSKNGVGMNDVLDLSTNILTIYDDYNDIYTSEVMDNINNIINSDYNEGMIANFSIYIRNIIDKNSEKDTKALNERLVEYLSNNNVDIETSHCIDKLRTTIINEIPDEYGEFEELTVKFINSEFSEDILHRYFMDVFILLYTSMIPGDIFIRYTDKISRMGEECQTSIVKLIEALDKNIENSNMDAVNAFADLYNYLTNTDESKFDESTYDEVFKPYVDKFVNVQNDDVNDTVEKNTVETEDDSKETEETTDQIAESEVQEADVVDTAESAESATETISFKEVD